MVGEPGSDRPPAVDDDDGLRVADEGDCGGARDDMDEPREWEWVRGRAGMRKPSASTRSRDLASRPFPMACCAAWIDDATDAELSPDAEKSESVHDVSPSDESADKDEMEDARDDDRRAVCRPRGDDGR